jgi:hypothetical protein
MSSSTFFLSEAALRNYKQSALRRVNGVSSSHMSEAVAAAFGVNTHAALRAALAGRATFEVQKPSNARLIQRLRQLGYGAPDDLRLLPDLDQSCFLGRKFPLRRKRSVRWTAWRNLMVTAVNAGLEQRLFGLSAGQDWWPGADPANNGGERGLYRFVFDGELPTVVSVSAIGGDELELHVLLAPGYDGVEPDRCGGIKEGAALAYGWLERRLGAWIMDGGEDIECKRAVQARVANVLIEPLGYSDQGGFR